MKVEDSLPVTAGEEDMILILYPDPVMVPAGIVMFIVPLFAVEFNVPMLDAELKLPREFES